MRNLFRIVTVFFLVLLASVSPAYANNAANADISCQMGKKATEFRYAKTDLNIRETPSIDSTLLSQFKKGDKVYCTENVKDGWREITYRGRTAFVCDKYLSDEKPENQVSVRTNSSDETGRQSAVTTGRHELRSSGSVPAELLAEYGNYGNMGRLIIPDVGINVAVHDGGDLDSSVNMQGVTDAQDSAAYFNCYRQGNTPCIADHKNQGFDGLYDVVPGTKAYILHSDGTYSSLTCVRTCSDGVNDNVKATIFDEYGNDCFNQGYDLFMYTCNPAGWWTITITFWNYD